MAAAVLMEKELQHSMATSEEDAEFEEDDELNADLLAENAAESEANRQLHNGMIENSEEEEAEESEEEEEPSEEDAEGEDDEEVEINGAEDSEEEDEEDEEGEGVGAVKIQPGLLEDDEEVLSPTDEEDESVAASVADDDESNHSSDAEVEERWVPAPEEEEEPANPNRCVFCQQIEENDPSEEFELYLACGVCGDNAHRQCARNADALRSDDEADAWYCSECVSNKLVPEIEIAPAGEPLEPATRRISRDRIAGDLLPSQRGIIKADSHSVFNTLIAPDDPLDGSRHLRKRKTSSADDDVDETMTVKTRSRDNVSSQSRDLAAEHMDIDPPDIKGEQALTNGNTKKTDSPISPRTSRSLRPKSSSSSQVHYVRIFEKAKGILKIAFRVDLAELEHITSLPPKPVKKKKSSGSRAQTSTAVTHFVPSSFQPFYSLHDKEVDELKAKPYGGILNEQEADTSLTLPKPEHRRQFDEARQKAEEEWKLRVALAVEVAASSGIKKARKVSGPASQIEYIEFGQFQIDIWYAAPYPEEYSRNKALFICEFCLKYMESDIVAWRHKTKCHWKHPPGDEIYRDGKIMIFEVDGRKNPLYCQNLCLLAKLFLGSKTLYYDVEPFLFYVMTEYDEFGCHFVGYFSKEKRPSSLNNVSCILVLPIHQRKGYGHLLIDFSYLLTRVEKKTGSPEKPLSDMGLVSYRNYWRLVLCYYLKDFKPGDRMPSIRNISDDMGLTPDDVISALDALGSLVRDPITGIYAMQLDSEYYQRVIRLHEDKEYATLNPKGLVWTPYVMGRGNASNFEHGPPLNTVAPREEDEDDEIENTLSKTSKRNYDSFKSDMNGETIDITNSLGKLTTETGEPIIVDLSEDDEGEAKPKANGVLRKLSYYEAASSVPATRFEVFPPLPSTKGRNGARQSASRPTPSRKASGSSSRPRPRRPPSGSSRRTSTARPRSSTARRRSGGTGRGPGRWPKGTKKSDFGNAESGPGLPPRSHKKRSRLGNEVLLGTEVEEDEDALEDDYEGEEGEQEEEEKEDDDDADAIMYETPAMKKRSHRDPSRGNGLGKPTFDGKIGGKPFGKGLGKPFFGTSEGDEELGDVPLVAGDLDLDAEGEEE